MRTARLPFVFIVSFSPTAGYYDHVISLSVSLSLCLCLSVCLSVYLSTYIPIYHFITNKKENVINSGVYPLSISNHSFIYAIRKIGIPRGNPRVIESRKFKSFDESAFILDLKNVDWPSVTAAVDANDFWAMWKDRFLLIIDKHAPRRTI